MTSTQWIGGASCSQTVEHAEKSAPKAQQEQLPRLELPSYVVDPVALASPEWVQRLSGAMGRHLRLWNAGLVDNYGFAQQLRWPFVIPQLTASCRNDLWFALTCPLQIGVGRAKSFNVTALTWLCRLSVLSSRESWSYWDSYLTGSAVPISRDWWEQFLSNWNVRDAELLKELKQSFAPAGRSWTNLDALIRVRVSGQNERERFEATVLEALSSLSGGKMAQKEVRAAVRGPVRLGELGTLITIGTWDRSFDLMIWYEPGDYNLPELFTQQGLSLRIHDLLTQPVDRWPALYPTFSGVAPETWLADRCTEAHRFTQSLKRRPYWDAGLLKKTLVVKTKGAQSYQAGLESFCFSVFKELRQSPDEFLCEARQSLRDHLPENPEAALAFCLNWMSLISEQWRSAGADDSAVIDESMRQYWRALAHLCPQSKRLKPSFAGIADFVRAFPQHMDLMFVLIDTVLLAAYLRRGPDDHWLQAQIWQGQFCLGIQFDENLPSRFSRAFRPLQTLQRLLHVERQGGYKTELFQHAEKALLPLIDVLGVRSTNELSPPLVQQMVVAGLNWSSIGKILTSLGEISSPLIGWVTIQLGCLAQAVHGGKDCLIPLSKALPRAVQAYSRRKLQRRMGTLGLDLLLSPSFKLSKKQGRSLLRLRQQVDCGKADLQGLTKLLFQQATEELSNGKESHACSSTTQDQVPRKPVPRLVRLLDEGRWLDLGRELVMVKSREVPGSDSVRAGRHAWSFLHGISLQWQLFPAQKEEQEVTAKVVKLYSLQLQQAAEHLAKTQSPRVCRQTLSVALERGYTLKQQYLWLTKRKKVLEGLLQPEDLSTIVRRVVAQLMKESGPFQLMALFERYPYAFSISELGLKQFSAIVRNFVREDASSTACHLLEQHLQNPSRLIAEEVSTLVKVFHQLPPASLSPALIRALVELSKVSDFPCLWELLKDLRHMGTVSANQLEGLCLFKIHRSTEHKDQVRALDFWRQAEPEYCQRREGITRELFRQRLSARKVNQARELFQLLQNASLQFPGQELLYFLDLARSLLPSGQLLQDLFTYWTPLGAAPFVERRDHLFLELSLSQIEDASRQDTPSNAVMGKVWRKLKPQINSGLELTPQQWICLFNKLDRVSTYPELWEALALYPQLQEFLASSAGQAILSRLLSKASRVKRRQALWNTRKNLLLPTVKKLRGSLDLSKTMKSGRGIGRSVVDNLLSVVHAGSPRDSGQREVWQVACETIKDLESGISKADRHSRQALNLAARSLKRVAIQRGYQTISEPGSATDIALIVSQVVLTRVVLYNLGLLIYGLIFGIIPLNSNKSDLGSQLFEDYFLS